MAQEGESGFLLSASRWLQGTGPGSRGAGGRAAVSAGNGAGGSERGPGEAASFRPGDKVRHPVFGEGTVVAAEPSGGDWMVTVAFAGQGVKKLMAGFAKLELL